jgi:hypothetical protein
MNTEFQVRGLGEFARRGFALVHPDDHLLLLMHEGDQVAVFSQMGATESGLQDECIRHLVKEHGWCMGGRNDESD